MNTRFWITLVMLAGLAAVSQPVRAEEDSKAAQYREEARKLLQAAEDLERKEKADKVDKEEKKHKVEKEIGIKKKGKEDGDDKAPLKVEIRKVDKAAFTDKEPQPRREPAPGVKGWPDMDKPQPMGPPMKVMMMVEGSKGGPMMMGGMGGTPGKGPGSDPALKLRHMMEAARHLREAGVNDMAENVERAAGEVKRQMMAQQQGRAGEAGSELRQVIEQLRREVGDLREQVKRMQNEGQRR